MVCPDCPFPVCHVECKLVEAALADAEAKYQELKPHFPQLKGVASCNLKEKQGVRL